jgi:FixJ family two-component response regulator
MPFETLDELTTKVSDLPDKPNTQMSASELKARFDASPEQLRQEHNKVINVLKATTSGDSGAENIGSANISGVNGNTVHDQITDVFTQMQNVVLGQIPNKSITREKFANGAVDFSPLEKEIANLNLQLQASQRVSNGVTFGSTFDTTFGLYKVIHLSEQPL